MLSKHANNLTIEANTPATDIQRTEPSVEYPCIISNPCGQIRARHVIHCTEGHASHLIPGLRCIISPRRGQMTAQVPSQDFRQTDGAFSWSFYFPRGSEYLTQDANTKELLVGGGDIGGGKALTEPLSRASDAEEPITAKPHLAGVVGVVFGKENTGDPPVTRDSWAGIMASTLDGVPLVGMLPASSLHRPGGGVNSAEWKCAGYGVYGMVNARLCGRAVAKMLVGEDVSGWLPHEYVLTSDRMKWSHDKLEKVAGMHAHMKALMQGLKHLLLSKPCRQMWY